jgi:hypothetical protein
VGAGHQPRQEGQGRAMRPLSMSADSSVIRQWCETCGRFTTSLMADRGHEVICAEHEEPDELDYVWDDWDEEEDDE